MTNDTNNIEKIVGTRETGFKVPEGYFERFYSEMPGKLPERVEPAPVHVSTWTKIKPYVYLAAMFAGIWCMFKMFHLMSNTEVSLDNPPQEVLAELKEAPMSFEEMVPDYSISDFELENAVTQEYESFDELSEDLDMELKPQYANINVEKIENRMESEQNVAQNTPAKQQSSKKY